MICLYLNDVLVLTEVTDEFFLLSADTFKKIQCFDN